MQNQYEIFINGIEIVSCGNMIHKDYNDFWCVSVGLERLTIVLYNIQDIRDFWIKATVKRAINNFIKTIIKRDYKKLELIKI